MKGLSIQRQKGIAVILVVIFLGLAMTVATFGAMRLVNSTQSQSVGVHSSSQAQAKAWQGVDIVLNYLTSLADAGDLTDFTDALPGNLSEASPVNISLSGISNLSANIVAFDSANERLTVNVSAASAPDTKAEANSTVQVVFQLAGGGASGGDDVDTVLTFNRNLRLGGSIAVQTPSGAPGQYVINVNGDLNTNGNSISGVDTINATGNIEIGSGSSFDNLFANGDIRLTGSVSGGNENISALGNICLSGGASADGTVRANGSVIGSGGVTYGNISAIGESDNAGTQLCGTLVNDQNGNPYAVDLQGNSRATSVTTPASVRLNSGTIGSLMAGLHLRTTNWGGTVDGQIGGTFTNGGNPAMNARVAIVPGLTVNVTPLTAISIEVDRFDANLQETGSNYAFYYRNSRREVDVRNVSGIPDGTYILANNTSVTGPKYDRLCANTSCTGTSYPLCKGYSDYNSCFTYNTGTATWTVAGVSMSPGIAWFKGNLTISNGTYYNTFIATGNIATSGSHVNYAPNYAGYSGVENGTTYAPKGICSNAIYAYYPMQFCSGGAFVSQTIGNFAYLAGSVEANGSYTGGNIALGSSTMAYGSVLAGNEFNSGGSTTIRGYITAQAQGAATNNTMGGSTTIIVENLPTTYVPQSSIEVGGGGSGAAEVNVLWTRYL